MSNIDSLSELRDRKNTILSGGGEDKIRIQHDAGKLTAKERIETLMDQGSFIEIDAFVEHRSTNFGMPNLKAPADGVICGYGTVDGRLVYIYSQDYTVVNGAIGEMNAMKICKIIDMAMKMGAPVIGILDSAGARLEEGVDALAGFGNILYKHTMASGVIPQISIVLGPCAGSFAYVPALTDFIIMSEKTASMFTASQTLVGAVTGEKPEDFSSAKANEEISGTVHFTADDDRGCIEKAKILLSYLPDNNLSDVPGYLSNDDINRTSEKLLTIKDRVFDIREIVSEVADDLAFFESMVGFAKNIVVGFIRLNGKTVGVVANQPQVLSGAIDIDASDKAARFVRFCDSFNIPIISFTDTEGYLIDAAQEKAGIIRHGAKLIHAFADATVPKINVIVGKAYGGAYSAMNSKHIGCDMVYAWPTAEISILSPDAAASIIFKDEIAKTLDPISGRVDIIEKYRKEYASPYIAAKRGYVDDIIEPDSTRPRIIAALLMLESKRENKPSKKHGNLPL